MIFIDNSTSFKLYISQSTIITVILLSSSFKLVFKEIIIFIDNSTSCKPYNNIWIIYNNQLYLLLINSSFIQSSQIPLPTFKYFNIKNIPLWLKKPWLSSILLFPEYIYQPSTITNLNLHHKFPIHSSATISSLSSKLMIDHHQLEL